MCIPTGDTPITSDMCAGIHISRGYTYHCDTGVPGFSTCLENLVALISMVRHSPCEDHWNAKMTSLATNKAAIFVTSLEMAMNTI